MIFLFNRRHIHPDLAARDGPADRLCGPSPWCGGGLRVAGVALKLLWAARAAMARACRSTIALGYVAVFVPPAVCCTHAGLAAVVLLLVGGLPCTRSGGSLLRPPAGPTRGRPRGGHHEFFHAATVLAASCHYIAIWFRALLVVGTGGRPSVCLPAGGPAQPQVGAFRAAGRSTVGHIALRSSFQPFPRHACRPGGPTQRQGVRAGTWPRPRVDQGCPVPVVPAGAGGSSPGPRSW